jgi:argininosuccinate synthase
MESLTLDREAAHLKDELMPKYANMVYNGFWFAPEREMLQAAIDQTQAVVKGLLKYHPRKRYAISLHPLNKGIFYLAFDNQFQYRVFVHNPLMIHAKTNPIHAMGQ